MLNVASHRTGAPDRTAENRLALPGVVTMPAASNRIPERIETIA